MPDTSFYTQDQLNKMQELEQLKSNNYDRGAHSYLSVADRDTQQMYADASSAESYFQVTGQTLDREWENLSAMQNQRVSRTAYERAQNRFSAARDSHVEGTNTWLRRGLRYERRMEGILNNAANNQNAGVGQMARSTQPSHGGGTRTRESSHGHGHSSSSSHRHHTSHHAGAGASRGR